MVVVVVLSSTIGVIVGTGSFSTLTISGCSIVIKDEIPKKNINTIPKIPINLVV